MGRKRKSEGPAAGTTDKAITKKRKERHPKDKDNGTVTERAESATEVSTATKKVTSRLNKLERISRKLSSDPDSICKHVFVCGVEVMNAVMEIARIFDQNHPDASRTPVESQPLTSSASLSSRDQSDTHGVPPPPQIKDKGLETATFTHPGTLRQERPRTTGEISYDRLEVLGDAYLEVIATRLVWDRFQTLPAGQLSQARELLVKNETLAGYTEMYGFDKRAQVPPGYVDQPKRWLKTKGDIFEAYVAAVILSDRLHGFEAVEDWLTQLWEPKLREFQPRETVLSGKEELAKKVMSKGIRLQYLDESPPIRREGLQTFFIGVYLTGWGRTDHHLGSGTGLNKATAGDEAAKEALANKPLIDEIHAAKKEYDAKVQAEREQASA